MMREMYGHVLWEELIKKARSRKVDFDGKQVSSLQFTSCSKASLCTVNIITCNVGHFMFPSYPFASRKVCGNKPKYFTKIEFLFKIRISHQNFRGTYSTAKWLDDGLWQIAEPWARYRSSWRGLCPRHGNVQFWRDSMQQEWKTIYSWSRIVWFLSQSLALQLLSV